MSEDANVDIDKRLAVSSEIYTKLLSCGVFVIDANRIAFRKASNAWIHNGTSSKIKLKTDERHEFHVVFTMKGQSGITLKEI